MRTIKTLLLLLTLSVVGQSRLPSPQCSHMFSSRSLVYICVTGKVYHSTRSCHGLRNAKHEIRLVSETEAVGEWKRRKCKVCY